MLTLLHAFDSPRSLKALLALEFAGLPFEVMPVNLSKGEQTRPEFLDLNPKGQVPVLVDDGTPLWESSAIVFHIAHRHAKGRIATGNSPQHSRRLQALWNLAETSYDAALFFLVSHILFRHVGNSEPIVVGEQQRVLECLQEVNEALGGGPYLGGDRPAPADFAFACWVPFYLRLGVQVPSHMTKVGSWLATPLCQRALMAVQAGGS